MSLASYVQTAFSGGEISQAAQGRLDDPHYKISLNVCFNAIPIETGAWMRRPGTRHVAPTRGGKPGKLIPFAFEQNFPYVMEFTDGFLRFTTGPALAMTNDQRAVASVSAANPAVITTDQAHGWVSTNSVAFNSLGINNPLLQNRQFTITVTGATTFSIADAITGASIDGSTLGPTGSINVTRIYEIATNYTSGSWATLRSVQAETRTVLLNGTRPQVLQNFAPPTSTYFATFNYGPSDFLDGPYLDPIAGSIVSSNHLNGVVTLTFSYAAFDATRAYNIGDFVTNAGLNYRSLTALNLANNPSSSPTNWAPTNGGAAVNAGLGFVASDIGRLIRLLSEPPLWDAGTIYGVGSQVAYANGAGGFSYWTGTAASITAGTQPGSSTVWALNPAGAIWTWAQIVSPNGSGLIAPVASIGSAWGGGNQAAAFDGNTAKTFASGANFTQNILTYPVWSAVNWGISAQCQYQGVGYQALMQIWLTGTWPAWVAGTYPFGAVVAYGNLVYQAISTITGGGFSITPPPSSPTVWAQIGGTDSSPPVGNYTFWRNLGAMPLVNQDLYIGQHYAAPTAIQSAVFWPTIDVGITNGPIGSIVNLRAKATAPINASDGTLLGTSGVSSNTYTPITISSNDAVTTWNYVWFEVLTTFVQPLFDNGTHNFLATTCLSQAQFYSPTVTNGSVVTAQIRGPALIYNNPIRTWRLGVYSDTTGWPTCGTYHEGRIWLGGVVSNRFDAGVSNGLNGVQLNFAPTAPDGSVAGSNAISYICTGEDSNQLLWMTPDQQGVLFGTKAGEWLISAPSAGPMAPNNIKAVRVTKFGCANIEPRRAEHTLLMVQKFSRKIGEFFPDVFSGKYSVPNLSDRAKHLTVKGIAEIAYQQELVPTLWCRRNDGALIGATYKRDTLTTSQGPSIIAWHRHQLGSGRVVESICVGPSVGGNLDTLSMITNDTNTGIRHIELMTDLLDEGFALSDCWFLDDAIAPTSTLIQATGGTYGSLLLNGLSVHNGKTVSAWIAGLDCGDYVVAGGSITVPFGDGISAGPGNGLFTQALIAPIPNLPAVVGFNYNSDGQLVRPVTQADTGTQAGPGFAKLGRFHRIAFQVYGMINGSLSFGTDFIKMDPIRIRLANDVPYTVQQQFSGILRQEPNSVIDYDGMAAWRVSRGYPAFVMVVGPFGTKADG